MEKSVDNSRRRRRRPWEEVMSKAVASRGCADGKKPRDQGCARVRVRKCRGRFDFCQQRREVSFCETRPAHDRNSHRNREGKISGGMEGRLCERKVRARGRRRRKRSRRRIRRENNKPNRAGQKEGRKKASGESTREQGRSREIGSTVRKQQQAARYQEKASASLLRTP